ncbi:6058_t:CDS:2 [Entrophospora sp. SA101]|nr:6058_t:CDS:2 [Entrophospora sp. SA101]
MQTNMIPRYKIGILLATKRNAKVKLSCIHNSATHTFDQASIFNQSLKLSKSIERISTKSEDQPADISCENELVNINIAKASHIIINAYAVPF